MNSYFSLLFSSLPLVVSCSSTKHNQALVRPFSFNITFGFGGTHACPYTDWYGWHGWVHSPDTNNPCTTPCGPSWLRQISAVVYPLIGPYKRGSEVYRWHIRLAKAAGITDLLVSTGAGGPASCGGNGSELRAAFMDMLKVAWEENFKIGFGAWKATCASVSTSRCSCCSMTGSLRSVGAPCTTRSIGRVGHLAPSDGGGGAVPPRALRVPGAEDRPLALLCYSRGCAPLARRGSSLGRILVGVERTIAITGR